MIRFSARCAYLLFVPQGRVLIREKTECSKQNFHIYLFKGKKKNRNCNHNKYGVDVNVKEF